MNYSSEPIPESENPTPFRSRRKRSFFPDFSDHSRIDFITQLARRVEPTFDFFLFSLLAGAVLSLGNLFHAPALLVVGSLLVPFMAPVIGLSLSTAVGSLRFFIVSCAGLLVGVFLIFMTGLVGGLASPVFSLEQIGTVETNWLARWDLIAAYLFGVVLTTLSLVKSEQTPILPSAMLSYALLTQVSEVGFLIGIGEIEPALVISSRAGWMILAGLVLGTLLFWFFAFRPEHPLPYILVVAVLAGVVWIGWNQWTPAGLPEMAIKLPWVSTPNVKPGPTHTNTPTPQPQPTKTTQISMTPTSTMSPSPSATHTPTATTVILVSDDFQWALVAAEGQSGARIREHPSFDGKVVRIVDNDLLIKILPQEEFHDKVWWSKVKLIDGTIGWMVRSVLNTTTPMPAVNPSPTP